jgi:hypothetical protein
MTKAELLAELATKFYKVGKDEPANSSKQEADIWQRDGIKWETVLVYEVDEDSKVMVRKTIGIYVANEGKPGEQAFYTERLPEKQLVKPVPVVTEPIIKPE